MFNPSHPKRGLSIIEILVALGILTFAVLSIYTAFMNTSNTGKRQRVLIRARMLAQQDLAQLRACEFESLRQYKPSDQPEPYPNTHNLFRKTLVQSLGENTLLLSVEVGRQEPGNISGFSPGQSYRIEGIRKK
jgi:type II secretory pathway pseudopilin PulG